MKIIICPECGNRMAAGTEKCSECDFPINDYLKNNSSEKKKKKNWFPLAILAGVFLLVIIVVRLFSALVDTRSYEEKVFVSELDSESSPEPSTESSTIDIHDNPQRDLSSEQQKIAKESTQNASTTTANDASDIVAPPDDSKISTYVNDYTTPVGVYSGDDNEVLVIADNGYAYYYCISIEFIELECPWRLSGNTVSIDFSKLHCTVSADVSGNDYHELLFLSDSNAWNPELFSRLDVAPEDYLQKKVRSNDPDVTVLSSGTLTFDADGLNFIIPKRFRDLDSEFTENPDVHFFVDADSQTNYTASILTKHELFISSEKKALKTAEDKLLFFCKRYGDSVGMSDVVETIICDRTAYYANFSCYYNSGFSQLSGDKQIGRVYLILDPDKKHCLYLYISQSDDRTQTDRELYPEIVDQITVSE